MSWPGAPRPLHYNLRMEKNLDRLVVVCACVALALARASDMGTASLGPAVVGLLCAVAVAAAGDLTGAVAMHARRAAPALCALLCLRPDALVALPLGTYAVATSHPLLALVTAVGPVAWGLAGAADPCWCAVVVGTCLASALLCHRTSALLAGRRGLHRLEDQLSDRVLALREKNSELEEARDESLHAATLAERTRIAREVHDGVGHQLTRLLYQAEALKVVHAGDEGRVHELDTISTGIGEAMDSMRRSVHALADSAVELGPELGRLAAGCGIPQVEVDCDPDAQPPVEVTRCVCALVREALTNAVRHAGAMRASVRVSDFPGLWQVVVRNDGRMPARVTTADPGADALGALSDEGLGLLAMRERVERLGGSVRVMHDREFTVFASIPKGRP